MYETYWDAIGVNKIMIADAYKYTHHMQLDPSIRHISSYQESRGKGDDPTDNGNTNGIVFFGNQHKLMKLAEIRVTEADVNEAERICEKMFFGQRYFPREDWMKVVNKYGGKLPIRIRSNPEGTWIAKHQATMRIDDLTDGDLPWITQFIETVLSHNVLPTNTATLSYEMYKMIRKFAELTIDLPDDLLDAAIAFHVNDFGMRGEEIDNAGAAGAGHLLSFMGTDNLFGIQHAMHYYNSDVCGHSVYATEHSTTTSWGQEREVDAYRHFLTTAPDNAIISIVTDSYDHYNAVRNIFGQELRDLVLARSGKTVMRPDSGHPPVVSLDTLNMLKAGFGASINGKGYFDLNPKVGMIYGDWMSYKMMKAVLERVVYEGNFSIANIVFGIGGQLLRAGSRDTHKFAIKASSATLEDGSYRDVYKTTSSKKSKRGRLAVVLRDGIHHTLPEDEVPENENELKVVFENGEVVHKYTFDECKANLKNSHSF